jgi:hypothetical protein
LPFLLRTGGKGPNLKAYVFWKAVHMKGLKKKKKKKKLEQTS